MPFDSSYFARQYRARAWRSAGQKPILDRTRLRWLSRYVDGGRLLEIGCGLGQFATVAGRRFNVLAADLVPAVVHEAAAASGASGIAASASALPLADATIDAVCCFDVLEHLETPESCLAEVRRVLRPGGIFFISVPNPGSLGARRKGEQSFIYRDPTHCSVLTPEQWRALFAAHDLVERWSGTDGLWDPPYLRLVPRSIQWLAFVGLTQLAWMIAPGFPWRQGENFTWLGERGA
jgi:2-polyprenyl-3-methyl-5-hydroxy-6-metoxy-1,4-benzoquinol methylase